MSATSFLGSAYELRKIFRQDPPDLIHTTLFEADVAGRLAAAGTRIPVLSSLVNTTYERIRLADPNVGRAGLFCARAIDGWTARHLTDHFHAISEAVKDSAVRWLRLDPERISVIPRGRDPDRLGEPSAERRSEARAALGLAREEEVVVSVGRQEFQKGQEFLLRAMGRLAATHPATVCLIAGRPGHASGHLQGLHRELGLGPRVRFLGHREDVPDLLAAADVFAFPSLYEGLGGAVIEAMALGLPVVASDLPALHEVVEPGRNALLIPPQDPEALAAALRRLLRDKGMARAFGERSREIFLRRFTIDRSADALAALYRRVAAMGRASRCT